MGIQCAFENILPIKNIRERTIPIFFCFVDNVVAVVMPPIEVSRPETRKKLYRKGSKQGLAEKEKIGAIKKLSTSDRLYGILEIPDTSVIDEIAERDQFE